MVGEKGPKDNWSTACRLNLNRVILGRVRGEDSVE